MSPAVLHVQHAFYESRSSGLERKLGGKFHLKLNMGSKPIANKYHEGKMKRTLKRELKVPELAERKADGTSVAWCRLPRATVIAYVISASGGMGFDLAVRGCFSPCVSSTVWW